MTDVLFVAAYTVGPAGPGSIGWMRSDGSWWVEALDIEMTRQARGLLALKTAILEHQGQDVQVIAPNDHAAKVLKHKTPSPGTKSLHEDVNRLVRRHHGDISIVSDRAVASPSETPALRKATSAIERRRVELGKDSLEYEDGSGIEHAGRTIGKIR